MIARGTLLERLESGRCLIDGKVLEPGDVVVSGRVAPHLYSLASPVQNGPLVEEAVDAVLEALASPKSVNGAMRSLMRKFLARNLGRAELAENSREKIVHKYLFHFWRDVWEDSDCTPITLDEGCIPQDGRTWEGESPFFRRLVPRFNAEAPVDILALSEPTIYLVEVKYGGVDDRAIGQLLRYFETARFLCTVVDHLCDIRHVVPVLIARDCSEQFWVSLSPSFRELIRVYYYRVEEDRLVLVDGRKQLRARMAGKKRYSF